MNSRESSNVERPDDLLRSLQERCDQFKGREQHDAHELLRHLLEAVRFDDLMRFRKAILECCKYKSGEEVPEDRKKAIKSYGFKANDLPLGPDILFRGELISTLQCQDCLNTSCRTEYFLDLSLPVTEEKPIKPARKKDADHTSSPSKQQLKKKNREKKRAQKKAQRPSRIEEAAAPQTQDPAASNDESDDSDADVEDNAEPDTSLAENRNDVVESGYSSEKAQNGHSAESVSPAESGCAGCTEGEPTLPGQAEPGGAEPPAEVLVGCSNVTEAEPPLPFTVDALESPPTDTAPKDVDAASSALPLINEIPASPTPSPSPSPKSQSKESDEDVFDFQFPCNASHECERSDATVNESDPSSDLLKCSPTEGVDGGNGAHSSLNVSDLQKRLSSLKCAENGASDGSSHSDRGGPSKNVAKNRNCSSWTETLAPAITVNEGDCSVLSCLKQFTAREIMHSNNKVGCDECTKNKGKDGKTVLTNATKQLLISAPPAILIIQLKRFIADISRLKKMNRHVSFPMTLNLAPFCSVRCRDLKTVKPDQNEILYSLYGIVEHSGQMGGGHYVAYVKVRPALGGQDPRWNFLAPGREFLQTRPVEQEPPSPSNSGEEQWYYISDSQVSAVDAGNVERAQAYLLFYERVV